MVPMARRAARGIVVKLAADGDVAGLTELRDRLTAEIDRTISPWVVAALAPQLMGVIRQLREMCPPVGDRIEQIVERRARRLAAMRGNPDLKPRGL
jgi:hypothetical protein